jgi:hypothetical protein
MVCSVALGEACRYKARLLRHDAEFGSYRLSIGHDTVEKPPFIMGAQRPTGDPHWLPAGKCGGRLFPHAEVVGDVGPSLALLGDRLEGKLQTAAVLLPLRKEILARITTPGDRGPQSARASCTTCAR